MPNSENISNNGSLTSTELQKRLNNLLANADATRYSIKLGLFRAHDFVYTAVTVLLDDEKYLRGFYKSVDRCELSLERISSSERNMITQRSRNQTDQYSLKLIEYGLYSGGVAFGIERGSGDVSNIGEQFDFSPDIENNIVTIVPKHGPRMHPQDESFNLFMNFLNLAEERLA